MKWLLLTAVAFLPFVASARADYEDGHAALPARADYEDGHAALQRGDYAVAHKEFLRLAKEGHASAQYNLGFLYDYGEGVQQDLSEAAKWYRKAAEQGLAQAQFSLGIMYESGTGVSRDLARSYKWYGVAAETLAPGKTRDTVIESRDRIANQLNQDQLAAAQKMIASFRTARSPKTIDENSGTSSAEGRTATADQDAVKAPGGGAITSERARYESALAALQSRDYVTVYRQILPLAHQGHAHAQYTVGFLYDFGRGVEQDYGEAAKWYREAAEQGLPEAQIALGIKYESGTGVPRDLSESHRRYSLAVENLAPGKTRDMAIEQRDRVAKLLSQEQLATGQLNEAPTDVALSNDKVAENAPPGTHVGTVSARDPDAGDSLVYALTEDGGGRFVIDPASAAPSVAEGARLDFEAGASWQLERQVEGFTNTQTVTAFVKSENAKFMLRCENKDRIMAMFQPEGIISEAGPLFTRYRIGKHSTVKSENWISLYGVAAYIGAKKDEKNRQEIIGLAKSLMSGKSILIEAENQRETFPLTGSKTAIAEVLSTCGAG